MKIYPIHILILFVCLSVLIIVIYSFRKNRHSTRAPATSTRLSTQANISTGMIKILALGDSLTAGYGIDPIHAYPHLLEAYLNDKFTSFETKVINAGISGSTSRSAVQRLRRFVDKDIDILFLALGSNDGLRGHAVKGIKKNLTKVVQLAQSHNMKVILAGMKVPPNYGFKYSNQFLKVFKEIGEIDKVTLIPFLLDGVALKPRLNLSDRIHPNEEGHKVILKTIAPYFESFYD